MFRESNLFFPFLEGRGKGRVSKKANDASFE
jgi:hypothetical protein